LVASQKRRVGAGLAPALLRAQQGNREGCPYLGVPPRRKNVMPTPHSASTLSAILSPMYECTTSLAPIRDLSTNSGQAAVIKPRADCSRCHRACRYRGNTGSLDASPGDETRCWHDVALLVHLAQRGFARSPLAAVIAAFGIATLSPSSSSAALSRLLYSPGGKPPPQLRHLSPIIFPLKAY
jgi:hypothetical protein